MDILIKNINIIDVKTGRIIQNRDIFIHEDRIVKISKASYSIENKRVIDGTDKFIIPGLWDMHVHNFWDYKINHPLYLVNGVTGIREMGGILPAVNKLKRNIKDNKIVGPEIYSAGSIIDGKNPIWSRSDSVITKDDGQKIVKNHIKYNADFIKIYDLLPKEVFHSIAKECKIQKIHFAGHIPNEITFTEACDAGIKSVEHLSRLIIYCFDEKRNFDKNKLNDAIDSILKNSTWQCPTNVVHQGFAKLLDKGILQDYRINYLPERISSLWRNVVTNAKSENTEKWKKKVDREKYIIKKMSDNNVNLLAGTDSPNIFCYPGFSLHDELETFVDAGLSPLQALQTATLNPAIFLEKLDTFGTVSNNKIANLLILDQNPLEDIRNTKSINSVIQRGEYFSREKLDSMLNEVEKFNKRKSLSKLMFKGIEKGEADKVLESCKDNSIMLKRPALEELKRELNDLVTILIESNQLDIAEEFALLNISLHPCNSWSYCKLAECYILKDKKCEAVKFLKLAYDKSENMPWNLVEIIWLYLRCQSFQLAKEYALKSLEVFPYRNDFKFLYAHSLLFTGEYDKAKEIYLMYKDSLVRENDLKKFKDYGLQNSKLDELMELVYSD